MTWVMAHSATPLTLSWQSFWVPATTGERIMTAAVTAAAVRAVTSWQRSMLHPVLAMSCRLLDGAPVPHAPHLHAPSLLLCAELCVAQYTPPRHGSCRVPLLRRASVM
jgi:hypothetical protein